VTTPFGQLLGQAQIVSRALFDRILTGSGSTFEQWVTLKFLADRHGEAPAAELVETVRAGLRIPAATAAATLAALVDAGLVIRDGESAGLTETGRLRHEQISGANAAQSARVFDGLTPDDLAAAARVLTHLAARGRTELAVA
jgi:DNA-binding MarR family transcriptional regulator